MQSLNRARLWALALPLMTWPVAACGSSTSTKHEAAHATVRYLEGPTKFCLKGEAVWPRGDLPPEPPTLTADDTSATWTAKLLDRLDAMDAWADYVVAYCVRHAPVETPLRSFRPPEPDECDDRGGRAGDGSCMNNPVSTGPTVYSARTWYGGWLPVVIP